MDELVRVALAREAQGTTGLGEEIAIPHAKTDAVTAPMVGLRAVRRGVEWGSLDGTRARLVFMIAVPEAARATSTCGFWRCCRGSSMDADFRDRLQSAPDVPAVLDVLREIR